MKSEGIGFVYGIAVKAGRDVKLVRIPGFDTRDKGFPQTRLFPCGERICFRVPIIEVADNRHGLAVWGPDAEPSTRPSVVLCRVAAEMIIETDVTTLIEQIEVSIAEQ